MIFNGCVLLITPRFNFVPGHKITPPPVHQRTKQFPRQRGSLLHARPLLPVPLSLYPPSSAGTCGNQDFNGGRSSGGGKQPLRWSLDPPMFCVQIILTSGLSLSLSISSHNLLFHCQKWITINSLLILFLSL